MKGGMFMPYIIKENTLALIPQAEKTKVIEKTTSIILEGEQPSQIVSDNCFLYGSSLEGRQKGSSYLIGTSYKPPIIINDKTNLILIPTHSVRNKDCIWVTLKNILNYYQTEDGSVILEFTNHKKIVLNISYTKFDKQVLRATRLESTLRGRNKQKHL